MTLQKNKLQKNKPVHVKKRHALHHRVNSNKYVNTYWPYLPVVGVITGGLLISKYASVGLLSSDSALLGEGTKNSLPIIGSALVKNEGNNNWLLIITLALTIFLVAWLIVRNIKRLNKIIKSSEKVISKNYILDMVLAVLIFSGILLAHN